VHDVNGVRPRLVLVSTGGTIDALGSSRLDIAWYGESGRRLAIGELASRIPELDRIADIEIIDFGSRVSHALVMSDWLALAQLVNSLLERVEVDGVVVTHGTNTMEESAYFLQLVVTPPKPVVLVGAMRPASSLSADGYLNLVRAVQVAAEPKAAGIGILVVLNDTIFAARDVTKTMTSRVQSFQAPDSGPLGYADSDGRVIFYHYPLRRPLGEPSFHLDQGVPLPRVDVVISYVGADGVMIEAAAAAGAKGIVSAGTGAGHPTPAEDLALDRVTAAGVVVCQGSRVNSGRVFRSPDLKARGIVSADDLPPWKARVLLSLALTQTSDPEIVQELFDRL
jgi:L-asparaginase